MTKCQQTAKTERKETFRFLKIEIMFLKQIDGDVLVELDFNEEDAFVLGRGPLLKITDTKLSRNQAQIKKVNDSYEFSGVKGKQCYFKLKETDEWSQSDEIVELQDKCFISLMPEKYVYEVIYNLK